MGIHENLPPSFHSFHWTFHALTPTFHSLTPIFLAFWYGNDSKHSKWPVKFDKDLFISIWKWLWSKRTSTRYSHIDPKSNHTLRMAPLEAQMVIMSLRMGELVGIARFRVSMEVFIFLIHLALISKCKEFNFREPFIGLLGFACIALIIKFSIMCLIILHSNTYITVNSTVWYWCPQAVEGWRRPNPFFIFPSF